MSDGKYAFEKSKIIHGECLVEMQNIPDKSSDMILADLPYGTTACKWDSVIPFKALWEQYERIIKDRGAIVLFGSEPFSSALRMSNIKNYKYDWYWHKNLPSNFQNAKRQPMRGIETISVFYKSQPTYNPIMRETNVKDRKVVDGRKRSNGYSKKSEHMLGVKKQEIKERKMVYPETRLYFKVVPRSKGYLHPTQKPILLIEYLIKTYTNELETVLDNTMGSGSTGVACVNTNRNFIGIEKDDKYFDIAEKRINETQVQTKLF